MTLVGVWAYMYASESLGEEPGASTSSVMEEVEEDCEKRWLTTGQLKGRGW